MNDQLKYTRLIRELRCSASECEAEDVKGWGNVMLEAADTLESDLASRSLSTEIRENGCAIAALEGEPVFILLGRDRDAPAAIGEWAVARGRRGGALTEEIKSALHKATIMEIYQMQKEAE